MSMMNEVVHALYSFSSCTKLTPVSGFILILFYMGQFIIITEVRFDLFL